MWYGSKAPQGYARWTLRLLAEKCVELKYSDAMSHMTISRFLKKTNLSLINSVPHVLLIARVLSAKKQ